MDLKTPQPYCPEFSSLRPEYPVSVLQLVISSLLRSCKHPPTSITGIRCTSSTRRGGYLSASCITDKPCRSSRRAGVQCRELLGLGKTGITTSCSFVPQARCCRKRPSPRRRRINHHAEWRVPDSDEFVCQKPTPTLSRPATSPERRPARDRRA